MSKKMLVVLTSLPLLRIDYRRFAVDRHRLAPFERLDGTGSDVVDATELEAPYGSALVRRHQTAVNSMPMKSSRQTHVFKLMSVLLLMIMMMTTRLTKAIDGECEDGGNCETNDDNFDGDNDNDVDDDDDDDYDDDYCERCDTYL